VAAHVANEGLGYITLTDGNYEAVDQNLPQTSGPRLAHSEPQIFRAALPDTPLLLSNTYEPEQAGRTIDAGNADAIMLGRQLRAVSDFTSEVMQNRTAAITWCDHNSSCIRRLMTNIPVRCSLNPEMGREAELAGTPEPIVARIKRPVDKAFVAAAGSPLLMSIADRLAKVKASSEKK